MALYRKWIGASAALTIVTLSGPMGAFAGSSSPYRPPTPPPPARQQFNSAAAPPLKQKFNNASGSAAQNGKSDTTTSTQAGPKPNAQAQALIDAFRANARDITKARNPAATRAQLGSRDVRNAQENAPAPSNQRDKPPASKKLKPQTPSP
jgi:hypothetical protein